MNIYNIEPGMRMFYELEQGAEVKYIPVVVLSKGAQRVVIRDFKGTMKRIVLPHRLYEKEPKSN